MEKTSYQNADRIVVAIDCIIFGFDKEQLKLLLIKRDFEPERGHWSLMGGFLKGCEHLHQGAHRILYDLTGLKNIYLEQLHAFGEVTRDPVERTLSVAHYALIDIEAHAFELSEDYSASWFPIQELPDLIFDHNDMVKAALDRLQYKASHEAIGFELLPDKFTLPELQKLYECIYGRPLDKRNFRRRILSMDVLINTGEKEKSSSKKGAYLYTFDQSKFNKLQREGQNMDLNLY